MPADREAILDLWAAGQFSASHIAHKLGGGCTANVVVGIVSRARKAGDPRAKERGSPIRREPRAPGETPPRKRTRRSLAGAGGVARAVEQMQRPVAAPPPPPPPKPAALPVRVTHRECQAVNGDPKDTGRWHYCGAPTVRGAFCAEHAARFYAAREDKAA